MDSLVELFSRFFTAVNDGNAPYQWQIRLMQSVASEGVWPSRIAAPTSAGKTAVIEVHIFLNAFAGSYGIPQAIPRRLCLAVNRRALVDSQYCHAQDIAEELDNALHGESNGILLMVAQGLLDRRGVDCRGREIGTTEPLLVGSMHGGVGGIGLDRAWRMYPEAPMIIDSTPDMFGSRLLFRGYGVSRRARPVEAGLLAYDTVLIVDEAHLNKQLILTARQVERLEDLASVKTSDEFSPRPLQVVESTATQVPCAEDDNGTVNVIDEDFAADSGLAKKVKSKKVIELKPCLERSEVDDIVSRCLRLRDARHGSTAVILNTVDKALKVRAKLREKCTDDNQVVCVLGRMRPFDRDGALRTLLDKSQKDIGRFIVGTQALEVGIDYDCASMVTELAPAQSIVQRLGRVNRRGAYADGLLVVFDSEKQGGPYSVDDLATARDWIKRLPVGGVSSQWLSSHAAPAATLKRPVLQRLESWDVDYLSHTDEDLAAESGSQSDDHARTDLNLWLRDELGDEGHDIGIMVRNLPADDMLALALLSRVPPLPEEVFPCSSGVFHSIQGKGSESEGLGRRAFVSSDGTTFLLNRLSEVRPSAGTIVVLDADDAPFFNAGIAVPSNKEGHQAADVYAELVADGVRATGALSKPVVLEDLVHALDKDEEADALDSLIRSFHREMERDGEFAWVDGAGQEGASDNSSEGLTSYLLASDKLSASTTRILASCPCELLSDSTEDGQCSWERIICHPSLDDASSSTYEVSATRPVLLVEHEEAARECLQKLSSTVGLTGNLALTLCDAALWHDEGKLDENFQKMLHGGCETKTFLAKSRLMTRDRVQRLYGNLGLSGWRHEQLSAALAWRDYEGPGEKELLVRLVGTSHGHGRASFVRGNCLTDDQSESASLQVACADEIESLYHVGYWETIVHHTDERYGYWKVAYLEALLRAADVRVSVGDESWR